jgi:hypothetical protein
VRLLYLPDLPYVLSIHCAQVLHQGVRESGHRLRPCVVLSAGLVAQYLVHRVDQFVSRARALARHARRRARRTGGFDVDRSRAAAHGADEGLADGGNGHAVPSTGVIAAVAEHRSVVSWGSAPLALA